MRRPARRRPSRRQIVVAGVLAALAAFAARQFASADTPDQDAQAIQQGLVSLATDVVAKMGLPVDADTADHLTYLNQKVPLSDLQPFGPNGLDLTSATNPLQQAFNSVSGSLGSPDTLAAALDSVNGTYAGVHVALGCGAGSPGCSHVTISAGNPYTIDIPVNVTRDASVSLHLPTDVQDLRSGNDLTVALSLTGTLRLAYDSTQPTGHKFYYRAAVDNPDLNFNAAASSPSNMSFTSDLGFTKVTVTPSVTGSVAISIDLKSVHGTGDAEEGRITQYDWQTTQLQDFATVSRSGGIDAAIGFNSSLLPDPSTPDVTVNVTTSPGDSFTPKFSIGAGSPVPSLKDTLSGVSVADFLNVSPTQVLSGLGQLAASIQAVQTTADVHMPFLQNGLTSPLKVVNDLVQTLGQQTVACGTDNSSTPPTGSLFGLAADTHFYCIATTTDPVDAGQITWNAVAGATPVAHTSGAAADGTIGTAPTVMAEFKIATTGVPPVITATYKSGGATKGVSMPVPTAQELFDQLVNQAKLGDTVTGHDAPGLSYDPTTHAVKFHLVKKIATSGQYDAGFDVGDRLKDSTGLFGLSPDSGASVKLESSDIVLDLTFGVILVKDVNDISTHSTPSSFLDRFFVQVNPSQAPLVVDNASATATLKLAGRVGFLGVTAVGTPDATGTGTPIPAFEIARNDNTKPILTVDVKGSGGGALGGIDVSDSGGTHTISSALSITELLTQVTHHVQITPNVKLRGGVKVSADFGPTNLAHGGVGFVWPVTSVADLTNGTGLSVTTDAEFADQLKKFWEMAKDDPTALLKVILDSLRDLAQREATTSGDSGSVFDTQLPLVNTTPRKLLQQFNRLQTAIDEIASGTGALITCTNTTGAGATPMRDATTAVAGDVIQCAGNITTDDPTSVKWTVVGANGPVANDTDPTTVGKAPTGHIQFTLADGVSGFADGQDGHTGYRVHVDYSDPSNHHTGDLPPISAPPTLQDFSAYLAMKLGLPPDVLTLAIISTPKPGGGSPVKTLKIGLKYDICTQDTADVGDCGATGMHIPTPSFPINAGVDLGGGLAPSLQTDGAVSLRFNAHAQLDVGFPLDVTNALPVPEVLGSTGASMAVAAGGSFGATASLGPLSIAFGTTSTKGHDDTQGTVLGTVQLGGKVTAGVTGAAANDAYTPGDFAGNLHIAFANNGSGSSCGTVDKDYTDDGSGDPTPPVTLNGFACAAATMNLNGSFLGDIGFNWANFSSAPDVYAPSNLASTIGSAAFNIDFLLKALPQLLDQLKTTLTNAGAGSKKLPIIGDSLDAGADLVDKLNAGLVTPLTSQLSTLVGAVDTPQHIVDNVDQFLFDQLASDAEGAHGAKVGILLDSNGVDGVTAADVGLKLTCKDSTHSGNPYDCSTSTSTGTGDGTIVKIIDASFDITLGQGIGTDPTHPVSDCSSSPTGDCISPTDLPFDIGLDGLPLRVTGTLSPHVGWKARLNFGLSRNDGPYLIVNHGGGTPTNDVEVGASIGLGDSSASCDTDPSIASTVTANYPKFASSGNRCLHGIIGFLEVHAKDSNGTGGAPPTTGVKLVAGVHLGKSGDSTANAKLSLAEFTKITASFNINASADANLLLRAGVTGTGAGFPSVYGVLAAHWSWGAGNGTATPGSGDTLGSGSTPTPDVSFGELRLDVGQFLKNYLNPIFTQIQSVTSPFKPIVDTLQAPIPVVSDLAALVGKPPVTLIDLAETASGSDLSFIKSLIAFIHFVQNFDTSQTGLISLDFLSHPSQGGGFTVDKSLLNTPQPSTSAGKLVNQDSTLHASDATTAINGANAPNAVGDGRPSTFGVPGLDIPVIKHPDKIFQLLMGQDITLVEYHFGGLSATASFSYTFGPFMVGPVPVSIFIGGSVQVNGHLALGYDTTGLREVLNGGSADKLLDGLFFDTYDDAGHETPVVQLIGTVTAGAQVDLVVVKAGIEAGLQLTVNFFFDDPTPDGKMSFQDIGNKLSNPICLFKVSGSLDAFLKAFVEVNLFFYSDRFEFTILQLHLLDFSAACTPPKPEPATIVGHTLELNIGPHADRRNISPSETKEKIVVRPVPASTGHQFGVTIFGAYVEYGDPNPAGAHHITKVYADGAGGDDDIELLQGAQSDGTLNGKTCTTTDPCPLVFDTPAEIHGGADNDVIVSGDANDTLFGDGGSDKITAGAGNDSVSGGGGGDNIDGGLGDDTICSGTLSGSTCTPAAESTVASGGPGNDHVYGSTADDQLNGGPGLDPNAKDPDNHDNPQKTYGQTKTVELDGNDFLVGYAGHDQINGGPGNDTIYGDEDLGNDFACTTDGAAPASDHANDDSIDAGAGSDKVWGGSGDDQIKGASATDTTVTTTDNDFLCGNSGNDNIDGDPVGGQATGSDVVMGGSGNDVVTGGLGNDYVNGGPGNDSVSGGPGDDDVLGGTGRDYVNGEDGKDIGVGEAATVSEYDTGTGVLTIDHSGSSVDLAGKVSGVDNTSSSETPLDCNAAYDQSNTTAGNSDCVNGGAADDALFGGGGRDTVTGGDGADWESGGNDADTMYGGLDKDTMYGDAGDDTMYGDSGDDTMYGGADQDTMHGSLGADYMEGNGGADNMFGDQDVDHMLGGSGSAGQEDANHDFGSPLGVIGDRMSGGAGDDVMVGDNGSITAGGVVTVYDGDCSSTYGNDDQMQGGEGADSMYGGNGKDTMSGGNGADYMEGNAGEDTMHGDDNVDRMLGGSSSDTSVDGSTSQDYTLACDTGDHMFGDVGSDVMLGDNGLIAGDGTTTMASSATGTFGDDEMHGGAGQDQMWGELGDDTMTGDAGEDYLLGDLGSLTPASDPATWPGGAPHDAVLLIAPDTGGKDVMYGGAADDHMYGGTGSDTMQGGAGDDYLEGNGGKDSMFGLSDNVDGSTCSAGVSAFDCAQAADAGSGATGDQDDMIGGSSSANPAADKLDEGETVMKGNASEDVMLGDNGSIVRTVDPQDATKWAQDPVAGGALRTVTLTYSDQPDCSTNLCGGDVMEGDGANDRLYGEGGDDTIDGDATGHAVTVGSPGDDYAEGNQGTDTIHGNDGYDDLVGGSSEISGGSGQAATGRPDSGDSIYGDAGADVIAGDNAVVSKLALCPSSASGSPITQRPGMSECQRTIRLLDLGTPVVGPPLTYGNDTVEGGAGVDVVFGQAGDDCLHGNAGDDYVEGNQGSDVVEGNDGQDDLIGGSSVVIGTDSGETAVGQPDAGDFVYGGDGADLVTGDNAQILREPAVPASAFSALTDRFGMVRRSIRLLDLNLSNGVYATPVAGHFGDDQVSGGAGGDVLLGQDGNDWMTGGPADDYVEGNGGVDHIWGDTLLKDAPGVPALPSAAAACLSSAPDLEGPAGADGQDDLVGGSSNLPANSDSTTGRDGFRDTADVIHGDGEADFELGDNGLLLRNAPDGSGFYPRYVDRYPAADAGDASKVAHWAIVRHAFRLDVPAAAGITTAGDAAATDFFGGDEMYGDAGDDFMWGESGPDVMHGNDGNDDMYGELGADTMFGDAGEDAMLGDRGGIVDAYVDGAGVEPAALPGDPALSSPPAEHYHPWKAHPLDRRFDLLHDVAANVSLAGSVTAWDTTTMPANGQSFGAGDKIRGGPDHDSIHGAFGDDLANGDSGGDILFGDNGSDVMWGGKGCDPALDAGRSDCQKPDPNNPNSTVFDLDARGTDDFFVDYLFGGNGGMTGTKATGTPEVLDFRPRGQYPSNCSSTSLSSATGTTTVDPCTWFEMTDDTNPNDDPTVHQHHQGTDWIYGGWDRDVMEADVADNGKNPGDRLLDWTGTYNLYNHCNSAYGGFNDVRQFSPGMQTFLQQVAYALGAGPTLAGVTSTTSSGFSELALVYNQNPDTKSNSGAAYPDTPGHFNDFSCAP